MLPYECHAWKIWFVIKIVWRTFFAKSVTRISTQMTSRLQAMLNHLGWLLTLVQIIAMNLVSHCWQLVWVSRSSRCSSLCEVGPKQMPVDDQPAKLRESVQVRIEYVSRCCFRSFMYISMFTDSATSMSCFNHSSCPWEESGEAGIASQAHKISYLSFLSTQSAVWTASHVVFTMHWIYSSPSSPHQ